MQVRRRTRLVLIAVWGLVVAGCGSSGIDGFEPEDVAALPPECRKLIPLHTRLGKPKKGEWLDAHFELGQTYSRYLRGKPVCADATRRTFYVQPLGSFTPTQNKIVERTAEHLGIYYQLPVQVLPPLALDVIPEAQRRRDGSAGTEQLLTRYILADVLKPRLPDDAVAMIALTAMDLTPGEGWNYVFGQASLTDRVGVWSLHRFGNPEAGEEAYQQCLRRTMKTAAHETGHMFSISHCTFFNCLMCGSNHLEEADRRPMEVCPDCLAKLCFATGADPIRRFEKLIAFYEANGLTAERDFCRKSLKKLKK